MSKIFYLYMLVDPRDPTNARYLGQTVSPQKRLNKHISDAKRHNDEFHCHAWIRKLLSENVKPKMLIFARLNTQKLVDAAEVYWITAFFECGFVLTNHAPGGRGRFGYKHSEETKRKIGENAKARYAALTDEQKSEFSTRLQDGSAARTLEQKQASVKKRVATMTPERINEAARKLNSTRTSLERSETARKCHLARTPAERSEFARKGNAALTPEQRRENARKGNAAQTPEQRRENAQKGHSAQTPEQRRARGIKANAALTPEQRSERQRKAAATRAANKAKKLAEQQAA